MADRLSIGSVLKAARQARRVQQTLIATRAKVSSAALSHVESGRNHPNVETLKAYAQCVVEPADASEFIEILRSSDQLPLGRLSELVSPDDPDRFLLLYDEAYRRGNAKSDVSTEGHLDSSPGRRLPTAAPIASAPTTRLSSSWLSPSRQNPPIRGVVDGESLVRSLQLFLTSRGSRPLIPGGHSSDLGFGVQVSCDLIEMTRSLVFEVKSPNLVSDDVLIDLIGKSSLLKMNDFSFIVCLTNEPTTDEQKTLVETLRRGGAKVIWPNSDSPADELNFAGDPIL